jgi:glutathione S-transferase
MRYHLYNRPGSGGFVVEAALILVGAQFELTEGDSKPGTPLPESFRDINPWGQMPALVLPDGTTITETAAILLHLTGCFPEAKLAPTPGTAAHGKFLRWMVFANVNLYEAVARRGYPFRYTDDEDGFEALRSAAIRRMREALEVLETNISGPFLLGDDMTIADVYVAMFCIWYRGDVDAPHLKVLTDKVRNHPIISPIWQRHFGNR